MLSKSSRFSLLLFSTIVLLSVTVTNVDGQPLDCVNKNGARGSGSVGDEYCSYYKREPETTEDNDLVKEPDHNIQDTVSKILNGDFKPQ
ncbi:uncharacterized protein EV154DRAFT_532758 [Mucor mucedo]|uniref:uncharacterized protein n=1 Tax=Mucor mucedo TaxID=29922 RepID=UPI00221F95E8|nr:uncharacterized protein EV154DRAFT_532758 [Mucor mucedo]KAI7866218.1 hypothetical protein EV154DRAFT_532758 [Mucor mucedo]